MDQNSHSWGTFLCFRGLLQQAGPVEKERMGILKWRLLQIVVWSGSHHRGFPRDPKPPGWDFSLSHWSVTCRASKAWDAFWCLNRGLVLYLWNISFPILLYFAFLLKLWAVTRPFQNFLEFPSLFLLFYLMFSSFNSSFCAKLSIFCMGRGEKEIRGNKRFYFAWKLGRVWCELPDTTSAGPTLHRGVI